MKSNIYKDLRLVRGLIYVIGVYVVGMLITIQLTPAAKDTVAYYYYILLMLPYLVIEAIPVESYRMDNQAGYVSFALTLPGSAKKYVAGKFITAVTLGVGACLISVIIWLMANHITKIALSFYYIPLLFSVSLFLCAILFPVMFALGGEKMELAIIGIVLGIVYIIAMYGLFGDISFIVDFDKQKLIEYIINHKKGIKAGILLSVIFNLILFYLSFLISYKIMKKNPIKED